jgi:hypothetical protein
MLGAALIAGQMGMAAAAPLPTHVAAMKSAAAGGPIQVQWYGGWGWGAGAIAGAIIGGAIASSAFGYYGPPAYYYGYPQPYYGGYYYPRAAYYAPDYGYPYYGYYARPYAVYPRYYGWRGDYW